MRLRKTIITFITSAALAMTLVAPSYAQVADKNDDGPTRPYIEDEQTTNPDGTAPDGTNPDGTNPDVTNPDGTNPDGFVPIEGCYTLNTTEMTLGPGQDKLLAVNDLVTGEAVSVAFISDDPSVATVDDAGNVRGEAPGDTAVKVSVIIDGQPYTELQCSVSVKKNTATYKKLRKKLKKQKDSNMEFKDESCEKSVLTLYGFFYRPWKLHPENYTYGSGDETITLFPTITAKKEGGSSTVSLGIKLQSFVEIASYTSRSYKSMTIAGGGEKIKLSGSTTCKHKTIGSYIRWQVKTVGTFKLSDDENLHLDRIDKLKRILESKKPHITVKDPTHNRKYKCYLKEGGIESLKKLLKKYKKVLKVYW